MCVQYWPASKGKEEVYDGITVSYTHEEQLANFVIRNFKITKEGPVSFFFFWKSAPSLCWFVFVYSSPPVFSTSAKKGKEERTLLQFHYTEWHSHTCVTIYSVSSIPPASHQILLTVFLLSINISSRIQTTLWNSDVECGRHCSALQLQTAPDPWSSIASNLTHSFIMCHLFFSFPILPTMKFGILLL